MTLVSLTTHYFGTDPPSGKLANCTYLQANGIKSTLSFKQGRLHTRSNYVVDNDISLLGSWWKIESHNGCQYVLGDPKSEISTSRYSSVLHSKHKAKSWRHAPSTDIPPDFGTSKRWAPWDIWHAESYFHKQKDKKKEYTQRAITLSDVAPS